MKNFIYLGSFDTGFVDSGGGGAGAASSGGWNKIYIVTSHVKNIWSFRNGCAQKETQNCSQLSSTALFVHDYFQKIN